MDVTMKKREPIVQMNLSEKQKGKLKDEIAAFYLDERGEEIGMIEQMQLLDLFTQKLALYIIKRLTTQKNGICRSWTAWILIFMNYIKMKIYKKGMKRA